MPIKNLIGQRFGRLVVESFAYSKNYRAYWNCKCDCGNYCIIKGKYLLNGDTQSCGCKKIDQVKETGLLNKKYNKYEYIDENTVKVYFFNNDNFFICDSNDWERYKEICWHCSDYGYARGTFNDKLIFFHDLILNLNPDISNGFICDHINRNRLDNRKCNLRIVSSATNSYNKNLYSNNSSGYTGISINDRNRYEVYISNKYIGTFNNLIEARYARLIAERELFGPNPNKIQMFELIEE